MILLLLGLLDVIAGISLLYPGMFFSILFYIAIAVLIKGFYSFGSSVLNNYWLDWMGAVDMVTGIIILTGLHVPYFWVIPVMKGLYTVLRHYAVQNYL